MKQRISYIAIIILSVFCFNLAASAQSAEWSNKKHHVSFSYGVVTSYDVFNALGSGWATAIEEALGCDDYDVDDASGAFTLGYTYSISNRFSVGADLSYENFKSHPKKENVKKYSDNFFTIMPSARINWFNKKYVSMYSRVAAGVTFASIDGIDDNGKDKGINETYFTYQISAVSIEAGSETVRGFAELGVGAEGLAQIGLRVGF